MLSFRLLATLALALAVSTEVLAQSRRDDPTARRIEDMRSFNLNGFQLSGAEYWVYVAGRRFSYPDDVLWGFNPSEAPASAKKCALIAYNRLVDLLKNPPARFVELKNKGVTPRFYLWVNDYTGAGRSEGERDSQMWHWNSGPHNYSLGFWKWESTVKRDGTCVTPERSQVLQVLEDAAADLGGN